MKKKFFGANLKQNMLPDSLIPDYPDMKDKEDRELVVFVSPFFLNNTYLQSAANLNGFSIGSQDISEYSGGSYTAEAPSPSWFKQAKITDSLVGHSEQRKHYETLGTNPKKINDLFNRKITNALNHGIRVTYCVGETEAERARGATENVLEEQIIRGLNNITPTDPNQLIIAYEPRWVIGTDKIPTRDEIWMAHKIVREKVAHNFGYQDLSKVIVIYGGNMNPENAGELLTIPGVDGGLIGRSSLDGGKLTEIINAV
jgi:triosephosphate isomerase (TIM)